MPAPNVVPDFSRLCVAVVGDLVADRYLFGEPTRLSREAPVIVLRHSQEKLGAGGAANAARNLRSLGAETLCLGVVGRDREGRELVELLERDGIDVGRVASLAGRITPTKTRVLGAEPGRTAQQVLRIDREPEEPVPAQVCAALAAEVRALAGRVDALLLSDYGYGLLGDEIARAAGELCAGGTVVVLDPRRVLEPFRGLSAITPNLGELAQAVRRAPEELVLDEELAGAARELLERCQPEHLLLTLGNKGMRLFSRISGEESRVPAAGGEAVDVSGAGDTAAAAFTLALAAGLEASVAMRLANAAAGVVVMEAGAAACALAQLRSALPGAPYPEVRNPSAPGRAART
jgi:rfaE bifunctional protein kinase chain/domain